MIPKTEEKHADRHENIDAMTWRRSFLIAVAALKTPTRNGYNAQSANLAFLPSLGPSLRGMTLLLRRLYAWVLGSRPPGDVPSMAAIASQLAFLSAEWQ